MSKIVYEKVDRNKYATANSIAWSEVAPVHRKVNQQKLMQAFADPEYNGLDDHCIEPLREIGIEGKSIAQLGCNNGLALLSLKNMGAGECVGFDISKQFVEQANELAGVTNHQQIDFVISDIYDIPNDYDDRFDIVMNTIGVIGWMPNLQEFFEVYARLVKPDGYLFIEDTHPVLFMYDEGKSGGESGVRYSYFKQDPWVCQGDLDYFEFSEYGSASNYSFPHTLSEIFTAAMGVGFVLKSFSELDIDISGFCGDLEQSEVTPPMGMTMVWQKS